MRVWWRLVIVLALCLAPAFDAVKHGPAAMIAEADHTAFHQSQQGSPDIAAAHNHHSVYDHDHVPAVILPQSKQQLISLPSRHIGGDGQFLALIMAEALRRPPRARLA